MPGEEQNKIIQKEPPSIKELLKKNKKGVNFAQKRLYAKS